MTLDFIADLSKQFRECAGRHAEHNRGAEAVAIRAAEVLDRIATGIKQTAPMSLNQIGKEAHRINRANGWRIFNVDNWPDKESCFSQDKKDDVERLCAHMALVHTEVAEATEAIRHFDKENFAEEMGDAIIRIASICHGLDIDLEGAIALKLEKNRGRGYHHGGKAI